MGVRRERGRLFMETRKAGEKDVLKNHMAQMSQEPLSQSLGQRLITGHLLRQGTVRKSSREEVRGLLIRRGRLPRGPVPQPRWKQKGSTWWG